MAGRSQCIVSACLLALLAAGSAHARDKAGVLMRGGAGVDREMVDDMTEVLISEMGQRRDFFFVPKEELRTRFQEEGKGSPDVCLKDPACAREVGRLLSLDVLVIGEISGKGSAHRVSVTQVSMNDHPDRSWDNEVKGGTSALVAQMQHTAADVLSPEGTFVTVHSETPDADVQLDGEPKGRLPLKPIAVKPGAHKVKVMRKGYDDFYVELSCAEGKVCKVEAALRKTVAAAPPATAPASSPAAEGPPPKPKSGHSWMRIAAWSTAGLSLACAGAGGYFFWKASDVESYLNANCKDSDGDGIKECSYSEATMRSKVAEGEDSVTYATIFGISAGVLAAGSAALFIFEPGDSSSAQVIPLAAPGAAGLSASFNF